MLHPSAALSLRLLHAPISSQRAAGQQRCARRATPSPETEGLLAATSDYGGPFVAALQQGDVCGTQFHPEKSGAAGLDLLRSFLEGVDAHPVGKPETPGAHQGVMSAHLTRWSLSSAEAVWQG